MTVRIDRHRQFLGEGVRIEASTIEPDDAPGEVRVEAHEFRDGGWYHVPEFWVRICASDEGWVATGTRQGVEAAIMLLNMRRPIPRKLIDYLHTLVADREFCERGRLTPFPPEVPHD